MANSWRRIEPSDVGADMTVGSLIKNPGGGLAPIGGYICGTKKCVDRCAYRLSAPGLGQEVGANLGLMPALYQGFFLAPTVVAGAEKGAIFAANLYEPLGFRCVPGAEESRHDIIQAVELGSEAGMVAFCKGIQAAAPVDSFATPYPSDMPGYNDKVYHGRRCLRSGQLHRAFRGRSHPSALRRVFPGRSDLESCQDRHSHEPAKNGGCRIGNIINLEIEVEK